VARSRKRDPEQTRKILAKNERAARLLASNDFKEWRRDLEHQAEREGLATLRPNRSNFDRAMATGILGFVASLFSVMERQANPEKLKELRNSLEEEDGPSGRAGKHEPTGYPGISAIGEF
jgi:hypothetical protein